MAFFIELLPRKNVDIINFLMPRILLDDKNVATCGLEFFERLKIRYNSFLKKDCIVEDKISACFIAVPLKPNAGEQLPKERKSHSHKRPLFEKISKGR